MIFGELESKELGVKYVPDGERGVSITKYLRDENDVAVPEEIDGMPVKKIMPYAFADKNMKYLQLPRSLEIIDHHGFSGCRRIQKIVFPEKLEIIGNYAFYNCWDIREIHLPASLRSIGFGAFMNCEMLSELVQDKVEGQEISIGSIMNDLTQPMHVTVRHLYPDREPEIAKTFFTEFHYETVEVVSICRRVSTKIVGTGSWMRYCIGSQDIDYVKYDSMFNVICREDNDKIKITVAVERLMYPYELREDAKNVYTRFLREHAMESAQYFLESDSIEKLKFITRLGLLDREEIDKLIDNTIRMNKTEYTAFLMDYRHKNFDIAEEEFLL